MMSLVPRSAVAALLFFLGSLPAASGDKQNTNQSSRSETELILYERTGCAWCARWDSEVAPVYPKTDIGKVIPLRRINLDRRQTSDPVLDDPVRFTPTFVILRNGKEAGRITGYHNDAFFWGLFESIVERLPKKQS